MLMRALDIRRAHIGAMHNDLPVKGGLEHQRIGLANGIAEHLPSDITR